MFYQGDECFEGILKDGITPPDIQVKLFKFVVEAKLYTFNQPEARHKIPQLTKPFAYLRENVFHTQPNQSYFKARSDLYRLLLCPSVRQSIADTVSSLNIHCSLEHFFLALKFLDNPSCPQDYIYVFSLLFKKRI